MGNSLRIWGHEPPHSRSRRLGFAIDPFWGLGGRLTASPTRGPFRLQDPSVGHLPLGLLMQTGRMAAASFLSPVASLYTMRVFSEGSCAERSQSPPVKTCQRWRKCHIRRQTSDTHDVAPTVLVKSGYWPDVSPLPPTCGAARPMNWPGSKGKANSAGGSEACKRVKVSMESRPRRSAGWVPEPHDSHAVQRRRRHAIHVTLHSVVLY